MNAQDAMIRRREHAPMLAVLHHAAPSWSDQAGMVSFSSTWADLEPGGGGSG